jgi:hypothetical protein
MALQLRGPEDARSAVTGIAKDVAVQLNQHLEALRLLPTRQRPAVAAAFADAIRRMPTDLERDLARVAADFDKLAGERRAPEQSSRADA